MDRQIHHMSRCLGREFTFEEWVAYLKAHPDAGGEVVHTSPSGFGFNLFDVCLNPNRPVAVESRHGCFEVHTSQSDNGRWEAGYSVRLETSRYRSHPCGFVDCVQAGYPSENEAILGALREIREVAEEEIRLLDCYRDRLPEGGSYATIRHSLTGVARLIEDEIRRFSFVQLALF